MNVHLVDGTYELFRHHYALPGAKNDRGEEIAAARGVCVSMLGLLEGEATHLAVATDHVIESFRNDLYEGYKDSTGIEPELHAQFPILEEALESMGVVVWAMVEHEADDGLASGAVLAAADDRVEQILICTPDKDLAQCVEGTRVVQLDRRKRKVFDHDGVIEKFGVEPKSIPDYLALVGDSADGFPGLPGWGAKSASAVLACYRHLEAIPPLPHDWDVDVRGAKRLAATLVAEREQALLFRHIATLVHDAKISRSVDELRWTGPTRSLEAMCKRLSAPELAARAQALAER